MKTILISLLLINSAWATCMLERTVCAPNNKFQNTYGLVKVSCAAPGGPVRTTTTFTMTNPLIDEVLVQRELNTTRHLYLQVSLKMKDKTNYLKIDDRRFLREGEFHISTPKADFMQLTGYKCKRSFR